ncbi:MAG: glycerate kinase [Clostridia bacterium]|nr:glycerate kinase [Clostridia bacterium]
MKIIIAPDSFKGCLTSVEVASAIEAGIKKAAPAIKVTKIPVADGGEGTVNAFVAATNGEIIKTKVHGPFMNLIDSYFGILGDKKTAVIEMASAAGLDLIEPSKRNPMHTTTFGVGELIANAMDIGCQDIIIGIGGSATTDGGMGMAQALGIKFYDRNNVLLGQGGRYLNEIASIDMSGLDRRISHCHIMAACDVKNPLYGKSGASFVYSRQKGANDEDIHILDSGLQNLARIAKNVNQEVFEDTEGAGAAGGLGFGLLTFLGASLKPGIDIVIETCHFMEQIKEADLLITGEGKTDFQTAYGKVPVGLALAAKKYNVPVVCISGALGKGYEQVYLHGIDGVFSIIPDAMNLEDAIKNARRYLEDFSYSLIRTVLSIKNKPFRN